MPSSIDLADKPVAVQGIGAAGYPAIDLRRLALFDASQEGVIGAGDFKVTSGGALTLSVAAGEAAVDGDSVANQGRYYQRNAAAIAGTLTLVTPPDGANPRIDQIVLEIKDDAHDASGLNVGRVRVVAGTATAGATLDNRTGAAALPNTCIRLADLLVPAAFAGPFVAVTHIRDRRPWARGAHKVSIAPAGADYTLAGIAGFTLIDGTNLAPRIELSGAPVRFKMFGNFFSSAAGEALYRIIFSGATQLSPNNWQQIRTTNTVQNMNAEDTLPAPPPGSYFAQAQWAYQVAGTLTMKRTASFGTNQFPVLQVEELVRQSADNST